MDEQVPEADPFNQRLIQEYVRVREELQWTGRGAGGSRLSFSCEDASQRRQADLRERVFAARNRPRPLPRPPEGGVFLPQLACWR